MRRLVIQAALTAGLVIGCVTGCTGGKDAVAQNGSFQFVAPGGKTDIRYDPPERRADRGRSPGPT